jgi:hypothetical protein
MMEADETDPEFMALAAKALRSKKLLDQARPPLDNARNIAFLVGSDALEGINSKADYRGANYAMGVGHAGALLDALALGASQRRLRGEDLLLWLEWIAFEQDGHGANVTPAWRDGLSGIANRIATDLDTHARAPEAEPLFLVSFLASTMMLFRAAAHLILPHAGQIERLIANYIAAYFKNPVLVFGANERELYADMNTTPWAVRIDLSRKLRDFVFLPGFGGVQQRRTTMSNCDHYDSLIIERHDWIREIERWEAEEREARKAQRSR